MAQLFMGCFGEPMQRSIPITEDRVLKRDCGAGVKPVCDFFIVSDTGMSFHAQFQATWSASRC